MRRETTADKIDFDGSVVAVTGGARGIGKGICEAFASLGADVAVVDIAVDNAEQVAEEIGRTTDASSVAIEADVTSYDDAVATVDAVVGELGQLDVLVNNAGIGDSKPFVETGPEEWDTWIGVSYFGTLNCTHAALDHMTERETGVIINFASDSYKGNDPGLAVYGGAKAANVTFTKTVAKEVGEHGIRVNCVSPGTTWSPATADWLEEYGDRVVESYALDRLGEPEDIADAVVFLSSDAADWITGQVLSVNGGYIRG